MKRRPPGPKLTATLVPYTTLSRSHEMQPGSVLFLPRGTWHRTEALEPSLSLSIVVRPPVLADALLDWLQPWLLGDARWRLPLYGVAGAAGLPTRSEEHTSELQSLMRITYAVFCLKKKKPYIR